MHVEPSTGHGRRLPRDSAARYGGSMGLLSRSEKLPADVRAALDLDRGERVLAHGRLEDGSWAVATTTSLVRSDGSSTASCVWCDVDRGSWDPESSTLTVTWVDGHAPLLLRIADPAKTSLMRVFRERVQASVVMSETVPLGTGLTARVAVRKDHHGALVTQVVADAGADLSSPLAQAAVRSALTRLRSVSGAPPEAW